MKGKCFYPYVHFGSTQRERHPGSNKVEEMKLQDFLTNFFTVNQHISNKWPRLATIGLDGFPKVRTMAFRGFTNEAAQHLQLQQQQQQLLVFTLDARSTKVAEIQANPRGELCWYFDTTRDQIRMKCNLKLIMNENDDDHSLQLRHQFWQSLSDHMKQSFLGPSPKEPATKEPSLSVQQPYDTIPPASFALVLCRVIGIDHLSLCSTPHQRTLYTTSSTSQLHDNTTTTTTWKPVSVNP